MKSLDNIIDEFAKLPGIGRKSAMRIAFYVLEMEDEELLNFMAVLKEAKEKIKKCEKNTIKRERKSSVIDALHSLPRAAAQSAGDAVDILEAAHLRHDLGDLRRVLDIEPHDDGRRLVAAVRVGVDAVDVDLHLRRHGEELCEHAALVVADDLDLDRVVLVEADIPADLDHAREVVVAQDVRAVRAVDGDAAALGDEARDRVAGDRVAAAG